MIDLRGSHRVAQSVEESLVAGHVANTDERGLGAQRSNFVLNSGHDLSAHDQQGGTRVNDHLYINNTVIKQVQKRKRSDRVKKVFGSTYAIPVEIPSRDTNGVVAKLNVVDVN